ncbi:MAG: class I SAM-dependent methyltransferase [Ferruginibacter sp.]
MTTNIFITKWFHVFTHPFFLIRHGINKKIEVLAKNISGKVLDFGCGAKPYAEYFIHAKEYIGLDIEKSGHSHEDEKIDVFYDGKKIPFDNDHFDAVFSSEVFEHIFNLEEILPEINRVLKPGGKLLFTCPFAWPEHEIPYDFARYSSFGIKAVVERQGFSVIEQYKTGHFFEVIMQYLIFYIFCFLPKKPSWLYYILHQLFILPFILLTLFISFLLPKRMKRKDLYFNNILLAEKTGL